MVRLYCSSYFCLTPKTQPMARTLDSERTARLHPACRLRLASRRVCVTLCVNPGWHHSVDFCDTRVRCRRNWRDDSRGDDACRAGAYRPAPAGVPGHRDRLYRPEYRRGGENCGAGRGKPLPRCDRGCCIGMDRCLVVVFAGLHTDTYSTSSRYVNGTLDAR